MKKPTTKKEIEAVIAKLEKANSKWFDTERARQIEQYKTKLNTLSDERN